MRVVVLARAFQGMGGGILNTVVLVIVNRTFEIAWSADVADLSNWDAGLLQAMTRLGIGFESGRENHCIRLRFAELNVLIRDLDFVLDFVFTNRAEKCAGNELHAVLA